MSSHISNVRPAPDKVSSTSSTTSLKYKITSKLAYDTARNCLIDTLGCGLEALEYPACTKLLGPGRARHGGAATAPRCPAPSSSSIRSRPPSTSAP